MNQRIAGLIILWMAWQIPGTSEAAPQAPSHVFALYSYGRSIAPDRTHTFGYFAKLVDGDPSRIEEHVPFSWLALVTKPRQDPDGQPALDNFDTFQIAPVASGTVPTVRLGWNFSMAETIAYRRKMGGLRSFKAHGVFAITAEQYAAAKNFREDLLQTVRLVMNDQPRQPDRFYYKPINQSLFVCPEGRISGHLNCFQAVLAAFGICETSGPLSGVTVTDYLLTRLRARGVISSAYLTGEDDLRNLLDQVLLAESSGGFDRP